MNVALTDEFDARQKAMKEGKKKERKEVKLKIAKLLLKQKIDKNIISQSTKLSIEKLKKLT